MSIIIKNGRLFDPKNNIDENLDIYIKDGLINDIGKKFNYKAEITINAKNKYIFPSLVDLHVHLREPGFEYKEDIKSGSMAAAAGGYTTICAMPNTKPVCDNPEIIKYIKEKSKNFINVLPIASQSIGQKGEALVNMQNLKEAGAIAFSEDGKSLMNAYLMKKSLEMAKTLDSIIFAHCEDINIVNNGVMHEGEVSNKLRLKGISRDAEDLITYRDIFLADRLKAKLHICHVSTKAVVDFLRQYKREGLSAEVCPHHFILTDEDIYENKSNTNFKMNPPLRTNEDLKSIIEAIKDGTIEAIATDHAPHSIEEKNENFASAPFGIIGLETAFSLSYTYLVKAGHISLKKLIELMSLNPARIIGEDRGTIAKKEIADLFIVDLDKQYTIKAKNSFSKSRNTPFDGYKVYGKIEKTIANGKVVFE